MVCLAILVSVSDPSGLPVLGFLSNWGKLLEVISTRIRWPGLNTLAVPVISISNSYTSLGVSKLILSTPSLNLALRIPSETGMADPSGYTSTSLIIQSVSNPSVAAWSFILTGPAMVIGSVRKSLVYTSTSLRRSNTLWSLGPEIVGEPQQLFPPYVGTGFSGS